MVTRELPLSRTRPGVWARSVIGLAALPVSLKVITWLVQVPSAMVIVSPGWVLPTAAVISAALWTRKSVARSGEVPYNAAAAAATHKPCLHLRVIAAAL